MSEVEKATRNVVLDADVSGWQQKELDIQASGPQYRAYVLLEYSDVRASTFLHDRLTKDNNLYTKIKSTKAFEELDEAVRQQNEIELEKLRIAAE